MLRRPSQNPLLPTPNPKKKRIKYKPSSDPLLPTPNPKQKSKLEYRYKYCWM
jgi:hypothetical protein